MAFLDLSTVTEILKQLIDLGIKETGAMGSTFEVVTLPPDQITASVDTLSLFLIHVGPDASNRAFSDSAPSHEDLAVRLRFQITAHNRLADSRDSNRLQKLLGLAMRVLHSYPRLDGDTVVNATNLWTAATVLDPIAELDVTLMPVAYEQSLTHWNAMDSALRPAVYYEVGNVYLEPLERIGPGEPVLDPSAEASVGAAPFVTGTRADVLFETAEGGNRPFRTQPARAEWGSPIDVIGTNLVHVTRIEISDVLTHIFSDTITKLTGSQLTFMLPQHSSVGRIAPGLKRVRVGSERGWSNVEAIWVVPSFSVSKIAARRFSISIENVESDWEISISVAGDPLEEVTGPIVSGSFRRFSDRVEFEAPSEPGNGRALARLAVNGASTGPIWVEIG